MPITPASDTSTSGVRNIIPRLNDRNYAEWSASMEYQLDKEGTLWTILQVPNEPLGDGDIPEFGYLLNLGSNPTALRFREKWRYDSAKAIRAMLPFLDATRRQEVIILKAANKTASEIWGTLKERYQKSNDSTNMELIIDLVHLDIQREAPLEHVQRTFDKHLFHLNKLRTANITVEQILTSFTMRLAQQAFPSIVDSLSCRAENLTPEIVVERCLESARRNEESENISPKVYAARTVSTGKRYRTPLVCEYCGYNSHDMDHCWVKDPNKAPSEMRARFERLKEARDREDDERDNKRKKPCLKV